MGDLVRRAGSRTAARWRLDLWWREIQASLHCLLNTEEAHRLQETLGMFRDLALYRIQY